jgi:3-deoxy-manno-octulosonate cytidylyltransferase (CMP-KDO synthetase)
VGVIPARWGSTRFPGKSLAPVGGKPLVQWVCERASRASRLAEVCVATDDARIAKAVSEFGFRAVMTRPDHPSGTDRVAEAARALEADIVVNIQGDEPLIEPALIDELVSALTEDTRWDMATAACPIRTEEEARRPTVCKVLMDKAGGALYFSRHAIPFVRDPDRAPAGLTRWRHIGIYLYRRPFLERLVAAPPCMLEQAECLEQLRALYLGGRIRVVTTEHLGLGVDVPADVAEVESEMRARGLIPAGPPKGAT